MSDITVVIDDQQAEHLIDAVEYMTSIYDRHHEAYCCHYCNQMHYHDSNRISHKADCEGGKLLELLMKARKEHIDV